MFIIAGESLIDLVAGPDGSFSRSPAGRRTTLLERWPCRASRPATRTRSPTIVSALCSSSTLEGVGRAPPRTTSAASLRRSRWSPPMTRGQPHYSFYREGVADRDIDATRRCWPRFRADALGVSHRRAGAGPAGRCPRARRRAPLPRAGRRSARVDVNMRPQVAHSMGIGPEPLSRGCARRRRACATWPRSATRTCATWVLRRAASVAPGRCCTGAAGLWF